METQELVTFNIDVNNFARFERDFAVLVKKAAKCKVERPTFRIIEEKNIPAVLTPDGQVFKKPRHFFIVTVSGPAPKLAGWSFVAVLQHEEAGNIVRRVPGTESIKVGIDLRTAPPYCGHCKTARRRNDTYVVVNASGTQVQVGRNCLKDFTGHESPELVARWAEIIANFELASGEDEEGGGFGGHGENYSGILPFLAYVAASIRVTGEWLSRTKARDLYASRPATADVAWEQCFPHALTKKFPTTPADLERATTALDYAVAHFEAQEAAGIELGDYEHNLRICIEGKAINQRSAGIAGSLIAFSERLIGKEMERRKSALSEFQGEVGKRLDFILEVVRVIDIESQFGVSHLHILQDENGNKFKWKASSESLSVGQKYKVKGTVKSHDTYIPKDAPAGHPGFKQTVLSRCKAEKVVS